MKNNYIDMLDSEYNNYIENTKEHFPFSDDWKFMKDNVEMTIKEIKELWVNSKLIKNPNTEQLKIIGVIEEVTIMEEKKKATYTKQF